jgi:hypothetical protein
MSDQFTDFDEEFSTDPIHLDDENLGHIEYYLKTIDQGLACVPYEEGVIVVYILDNSAKIVHMFTDDGGEYFREVVIPQALQDKVPHTTIIQATELDEIEIMDVYRFSDNEHPFLYWEVQHAQMLKEWKEATIAEFIMGLHERVGAESKVQKLDDLAVQMILDYV